MDGFKRNPMFDRAEKCVAKLKGIASIQSGDRWNTYNASPQKSSIWTSINRTLRYTSEDRRFNLADIVGTIDTAFTILEDIYVHLGHVPFERSDFKKYQLHIRSLKSNILDSRDGMNNLKVVYHDDASICHTIDKKFEDIRDRYRDLEKRYIQLDGDDVVRYRTPPRTVNLESDSSSDHGTPEENPMGMFNVPDELDE